MPDLEVSRLGSVAARGGTLTSSRLSRVAEQIADGGWAVPAFLVAWFGVVVLPLLVLFAFSFFQTKTFVTIYHPSLDTWSSLFESGHLPSRCGLCGLP